MSGHRSFEILRAPIRKDPVRARLIQIEVDNIRRGMDLANSRRKAGKTQKEVAAVLGVSQANISRIERGDDVQLSTLRNFAEAIGATLEVNIVPASDNS